MKIILIALGLMLLSACSPQEPTWTAPLKPPTVDPQDTFMAAAQKNYESFCAHCHGYIGDGQGASSETKTLALGYKIVPKHDQDGHTWQHPDQLLFESIKYGIENPLNLYPMVEYGSRLEDQEIWGVIEYMKRFWSEEQRQFQTQLSESFSQNRPDWPAIHLDDPASLPTPLK
ncbi:hypothetical protein MASR2M15_13420 [Anaerolineales bacterium]